jgi:hypothetical protein
MQGCRNLTVDDTEDQNIQGNASKWKRRFSPRDVDIELLAGTLGTYADA